MNLDQARRLMHEWVESEALRVHMETVSACCAAYAAQKDPPNQVAWAIAGLLHDMDYEKHPTREEHPFVCVKTLENLGVDSEITRTILGHAPYTGVPRDSDMARTLFAVDELAGFIVACAKVRPNGIEDLTAGSVRKKLKDRRFAAAVSREEIEQGISELGVDKDEHITFCIEAIRAEAGRLGL